MSGRELQLKKLSGWVAGNCNWNQNFLDEWQGITIKKNLSGWVAGNCNWNQNFLDEWQEIAIAIKVF